MFIPFQLVACLCNDLDLGRAACSRCLPFGPLHILLNTCIIHFNCLHPPRNLDLLSGSSVLELRFSSLTHCGLATANQSFGRLLKASRSARRSDQSLLRTMRSISMCYFDSETHALTAGHQRLRQGDPHPGGRAPPRLVLLSRQRPAVRQVLKHRPGPIGHCRHTSSRHSVRPLSESWLLFVCQEGAQRAAAGDAAVGAAEGEAGRGAGGCGVTKSSTDGGFGHGGIASPLVARWRPAVCAGRLGWVLSTPSSHLLVSV